MTLLGSFLSEDVSVVMTKAGHIGERVREIRRIRALTQAELAEQASTTKETVGKIELGYRQPRPTTIRALAAALDVEVEHLTGGVANAGTSPRTGEDW